MYTHLIIIILLTTPLKLFSQLKGKTFCQHDYESILHCISFDNDYWGTMYLHEAISEIDTIWIGDKQMLSIDFIGDEINRYEIYWMVVNDTVYVFQISHNVEKDFRRSKSKDYWDFIYNEEEDRLEIRAGAYFNYHRFIGTREVGSFTVTGE